MVRNKMLDNAQRILDNYIEVTAKRKTPERYAVLKAIYGMDGHFTVEELNEALEKKKFIVSRATLYNTLRLLLKVNLVVRHKLVDKTKYEATLRNDNHSHQICTMCGKVIEVELPDVESAITSSRLYRFRKEGFSLYIYGICSSCQSKLTRKRTMISKKKPDNK
ncbi:MAG: transcriptional repressor [Prevotella sp.]|nr:transcriptional repressor [Prevotella sp.]MDD4535131.1 transcriptional repressor [Prevotella sp.]